MNKRNLDQNGGTSNVPKTSVKSSFGKNDFNGGLISMAAPKNQITNGCRAYLVHDVADKAGI